MKSTHTLGSLLVVSLLVWACAKPGEPQPVKAQPRLTTLTERFRRDSSSVSIKYSYNTDGRLKQEDYHTDNRPWFSRAYTYTPPPDGKNGNNTLRIYDPTGNLISEKRYVSDRVLTEAASTYQEGRLIRSEKLNYQYQIHQFNFPIQLSKEYYTYNAQNQLIARLDSVFDTYEYIPGTLVFRPISGPPKYIGSTTTTYQYNEQSDIARQQQTGNGRSSVYYQNGLSLLIYGDRLTGTITYSYEYRPDGLVKRKTAVFNDGKTPTNYTSTFDYTYSDD